MKPYRFTPEHTELVNQNKTLDEVDHLNQKQIEILIDLQKQMNESSKIENKRFIFQSAISVAALIAAVVAAIAALIPLF